MIPIRTLQLHQGTFCARAECISSVPCCCRHSATDAPKASNVGSGVIHRLAQWASLLALRAGGRGKPLDSWRCESPTWSYGGS